MNPNTSNNQNYLQLYVWFSYRVVRQNREKDVGVVGFGLAWLGYLVGKGGIVMRLIGEIIDRERWWRRCDGWSDHKGRDFLFSLFHYLQLWFFAFLFFLFICSLTLKIFILCILFLHSNFALTFFLHISSLSLFFSLFIMGPFYLYPFLWFNSFLSFHLL